MPFTVLASSSSSGAASAAFRCFTAIEALAKRSELLEIGLDLVTITDQATGRVLSDDALHQLIQNEA